MKNQKIKYFQYLLGEHQGDITILSHIDDSMPEIGIFYVFDDGFKCNKDLVGEIGDTNAFKSGCVIAQVPSMNNKWTFDIQEIVPQEKKDISDAGDNVIGADPYFFNKDGQAIAQAKRKVIATPPYAGMVSAKEKDLSSFYLSNVNQELIEEEQKETSEDIIEQTVENNQKTFITASEALAFCNTVEPLPTLPNGTYLSAGNPSIILPESKIMIEGYEFTKELYDEFLEYCKNKRIAEESIKAEEQSPIKILLDKSKLKTAEIKSKIVMQLPPVQLYDVVKELYGDEGAEELIHRIVENLTCETLQGAIAESINAFYSQPKVTVVES